MPIRRRTTEQQEFDTKLVDLARVTRVAAGGKRFRFRAVVIAGDKKGRVGLGIGKGSDVAQAMDKATRKAQKNLIVVPMLEETIPHQVEAKVGASRVLLRPQQKGRGLVAGGVTRTICEKAGIKNISAKLISKTHNKLNNALATLKALESLKLPKVRQAQQPTESQETNATASTPANS